MATYSPTQLESFYNRIHLPQYRRRTEITSLSAHMQLAYLERLMQSTLVHIPFEDLSIHYAQAKGISIDDNALYEKMLTPADAALFDSDQHVRRPDAHDATSIDLPTAPESIPLGYGKGGYCMQLNALFGTVLRTLGLSPLSVGARVYQPRGSGLEGFGHMINLLTIGGDVYAIDVGFGGNGAIHPLKLPSWDELMEKGCGSTMENLRGTEVRLVWDDPHAVASARSSKHHTRIDKPPPAKIANPSAFLPRREAYIFESRRLDVPDAHWEPLYTFVPQHFAQADYLVMNHYTSTHPKTIFVQNVFCVRMVGHFEFSLHEGSGSANPDRRQGKGMGIRDALASFSESEHVNEDVKENAKTILARYDHSFENLDDDYADIVGQVIMLGKSLKIRIENYNFSIVPEFRSEEERVAALRQYFGIWLTPSEVKGIEGLASAV